MIFACSTTWDEFTSPRACRSPPASPLIDVLSSGKAVGRPGRQVGLS